jgi:nucleoside-diphosphate-sugar epimerase
MEFVTGAAGEVGINLCIHLLDKGFKVIGTDNFITGSEKNLSIIKNHENFIFFDIGIENPKLIDLLKEYSIERIFHLACPTGVPNLELIPEEMIMATSLGTKNILDIALLKKASLLFASSSEVYGEPKEFPQREDYTGNVDQLGIRGPYEEGKRFSETLVETYVKKYNLNAKIIRIFNTFGPYSSSKDLRVIPSFIRRALNNEDIVVHGEGSQTRTFLYINDLIDGILTVLEKGKMGDAYNVGSDHQISILDLAKLVIKLSNSKSTIKYGKRPKHDHSARLPFLEKIKSLGWSQKISLDEGIKAIINNNR